MTEGDILNLIEDDDWMMEVLRVARSLDLPDWMIGAGFVRNKVWDYLHGYEKASYDNADVDLIYYDSQNLAEGTEKLYDKKLRSILDANWSTKNQARMHLKHGRAEPYKSSEEALSEWVETPTCVAVRLNGDNSLSLFAPHGVGDLVNLVVRPAPAYLSDLDTFYRRVREKGWQEKWPKLEVANLRAYHE